MKQAGRDFLLIAAVPSSGAAFICMLKRSLFSEVPAPEAISIWAAVAERIPKCFFFFGMHREKEAR